MPTLKYRTKVHTKREGMRQDLVEDVRWILEDSLRAKYPDDRGPRGFYIAGDASDILPIMRIMAPDGKILWADFYIFAGDGYGLIFVEVGKNRSGQWSIWLAPDGRPCRVLRVGLDGSIKLLHFRDTPFEADLLECLIREL